MLVALERRGIGHQHQLRARRHGLGQRLGEPQVLADDQADLHAIDLEHAVVAVRIDVEVAALVEHGVVGQLALAIGVRDGAVAQHAGGVVDDRAGRLRPADDGDDAVACRRDALQAPLAIGQERGAQQQVFRRITAERQFGKQHHVGAVLVARLGDHLRDALGVLVHRADREIELRQRDP